MDESSLDRGADLGFGTQRKVYQTKGFKEGIIGVLKKRRQLLGIVSPLVR
jgi:hypothetical protein